jgi:hypothetical protein
LESPQWIEPEVASGLELAVDMFSAHFFDTKDICAAMDEWNILQEEHWDGLAPSNGGNAE